ncbi:O-antigen/teichoic acid export membrane protein [Evansella vedderi]|uniref:O-antigen/teichoic acid export membrane protein n=1 Tax=Evansella vedderi TaxID=38282 RepID=A0ABT9ZU51_9BACI|nr:oligosaccharide flippase family protein [Evansella vedderi]MDQ0254465.1 O-antigen/teichoic acid export membrane protein [Evansella vedderi]
MGFISKKIKEYLRRGFLRNVITLLTGTVLAQAILLLSTPILTRIYSPEDFGLYGNFIAICAIITIIVSLRYELAIVLPKSSREAKGIVIVSVFIATAITISLLLIILLFGEYLASNFSWLNKEYLYLIPIYVFLTGMYQILNYCFTRTKSFKPLAVSQSGRSLVTVAVQILIGFFLLFGTYGLIIGQLIGQLFAVMLLVYYLIRYYNNWDLKSIEIVELKKLAVKYKDFPLYSSGNSFINTLSMHIPVVIITYYFSAAIAGFYMLAYRLVSLPMGLISNSITQVFLQKIASDKSNQRNNKSSYKLWTVLSPLSILINGIIIFFAPWAFGLIFGSEWVVAGEYARWIAFWTLFQFVASPLSTISYAYNKQKLFFGFQVILLILRVSALMIGGVYSSPILAIALFSIVSGLFNLVTAGMYIYIEAGKKEAFIATFVNLIIFIFFLWLIIVL